MSKLSTYKKLALELLEEQANEDAVEEIAQSVLEKHFEMGENEFNSDFMPDESDIPSESEYYQMIKKLVVKALEDGESKVSNIDIKHNSDEETRE